MNLPAQSPLIVNPSVEMADLMLMKNVMVERNVAIVSAMLDMKLLTQCLLIAVQFVEMEILMMVKSAMVV